MRTRGTIGAVVLVAAALLGGACSNDDEAKETTTTAEGSESSAGDETTTTLDDAAYSAAIEEFSMALDEAGTDLCAVIDVQTASVPPEPANSAQMEEVIGIYAKLLRSFAGAIPDDTTSAAAFNTAADDLMAEASEAGYPVDFLAGETEETAPQSLVSEEFASASAAFSQKAQTECAPSVPDGADQTPTTAAP